MRFSSRHLLSLLPFFGVFAVTSNAFAQGTPTAPPATQDPQAATAQPAPAPAAIPDKKTKDDDDEEELKRIAITLNPLSLILTRIGVNVEYLPARHHAIIVNPYFQSIGTGEGVTETKYTNFGGELGYRFYTGNRGANGFFVGPFVTAMTSSVKTPVADSSTFVYGGGVAIVAHGVELLDLELLDLAVDVERLGLVLPIAPPGVEEASFPVR